MIYDPYPFKRCTKCGAEYPATKTFFYAQASTKCGLEPDCKRCRNASISEWQRNHSEQNKAYHKQYRREHTEQAKAYREQYYREHSEKIKANSSQWQHEHLDNARAKQHKRRAQKRNSGGAYSAKDIQAQFKRQKGRCYYCGAKVGKTYHIDHVIPLSRGGSNGPDNLVIACPPCNRKKHDKLPHEWPEGGRLL